MDKQNRPAGELQAYLSRMKTMNRWEVRNFTPLAPEEALRVMGELYEFYVGLHGIQPKPLLPEGIDRVRAIMAGASETE